MWTGGSNPAPWQPLPTATRCLDELPASLEKLSLEQITLAPDALKACTLPRLRSLRLRDCGAETEMRTLAAELTEACPMLEEDKVQVHAYTGRRR